MANLEWTRQPQDGLATPQTTGGLQGGSSAESPCRNVVVRKGILKPSECFTAPITGLLIIEEGDVG